MKKTILLIICTLTSSLLGENDLKVRGVSHLKKPADTVRLSIGVVSQETDATASLAANSELIQKVMGSIKQMGLKETGLATGQFSISPVYEQAPRQIPDNWSPKIVAYRVSNTLDVTTGDIDKTGAVIDAAAKAGANQINGISFELKDPRMFREEAIQAATIQAFADAKTLADAADVSILGVQSLRLVEEGGTILPKAAMLMSHSTPIEARDVEISATVEIEFEITERDNRTD